MNETTGEPIILCLYRTKKRHSLWYNVVLLDCMKLAHCTWMIRTSNPTISCVIYKYQGERVYKPFQLFCWVVWLVEWSTAASIAFQASWQARVFWIVKRKATKPSIHFFSKSEQTISINMLVCMSLSINLLCTYLSTQHKHTPEDSTAATTQTIHFYNSRLDFFVFADGVQYQHQPN